MVKNLLFEHIQPPPNMWMLIIAPVVLLVAMDLGAHQDDVSTQALEVCSHIKKGDVQCEEHREVTLITLERTSVPRAGGAASVESHQRCKVGKENTCRLTTVCFHILLPSRSISRQTEFQMCRIWNTRVCPTLGSTIIIIIIPDEG